MYTNEEKQIINSINSSNIAFAVNNFFCNSIEILNELYPDIIDKISSVIRDGNKYGIYFIITTETQNSIKMKVTQSCKNLICLQLSNELVYRDILGKTNGLVPANNLGRGLIKRENVCEFQTAMITKFGEGESSICIVGAARGNEIQQNKNSFLNIPFPSNLLPSKFLHGQIQK